jgi:hypothetical protein
MLKYLKFTALLFFQIILLNGLFNSNLQAKEKRLNIPVKVYENSRVIRVTNLNSEGPGSFREAVEATGPRVIVFEAGGVIDLNKSSVNIREPFVTIAGQTAPSPGITFIKGGIRILTHDVFIQHIRVRPGDAGEPKRSGWEPDGISTSGGECYNIVVDHCSVTWAVDENLSASGARTEGPDKTSHKVTFSNCIIAEGLDDSSHAKGKHSKGSLIHDFCREISIIGNLYAHNSQRNPYFKAHTTGAVINNLIYNPRSSAIKMDYPESEWKEAAIKPENGRISVVGNVLHHGVNTRDNVALIGRKGDVYVHDNLSFYMDGSPAPLMSGDIEILSEKPFWPENIRPIPASEVVDYVTTNAGARPKDRDKTDKRIIKDFQKREGKIIDSQDEVGGYLEVKMKRRNLQIPVGNLEAWLNKLTDEVQ